MQDNIKRMIAIEQDAIELYMKHNPVFQMGFEALPAKAQKEYKKLYKAEYKEEYVNRY